MPEAIKRKQEPKTKEPRSNDYSDVELLVGYGIYRPTRTIILTGEVDSEMYETLVTGLTLLLDDDAEKEITIELCSPGGDWYQGIAMYDRIKSCAAPVTIKATGMAMSMGSVILQAADTRIVSPGTSIMIHDGQDVVEGSPENVLAWAKHGEAICNHMYQVYADASGKTRDFWKKRCKKDFILTAAQAVKLGLADEIME